jgi:lipopolysaccharide transport system ATP-binding protein
MSDIAIKVEKLSKRYRIGLKEEMPETLSGAITSWLKAPLASFRQLRRLSHFSDDGREPDDVIWALKDVSFEVKQGEVVGIIGRNGAGKTTLLKILSRITEPTSGRAVINGRVSSLLEVGTGFHPELTGRENVYLNGTVLGMSKQEVDRKFDEIVGFSGVEKFIDTPVKRYSSGMQVRLAFSVAAHLEPEILLIDEVLAVGDAAFQKKCLGKMGEVARAGRTVLFVSHNMLAIDNLCDWATLVEAGQLVATGATSEIIGQYLTMFDTTAGSCDLTESVIKRRGTGEARFQRVEILSTSGESTSSIPMGKGMTIRMEILAQSQLKAVEIVVSFFNAQGLHLCGFNSYDLADLTFDLEPGQSIFFDCAVPRMNLAPGVYRLSFQIRTRKRHKRQLVDFVEQVVSFEVVPADVFGTGRLPRGHHLIFLEADWSYSEYQ